MGWHMHAMHMVGGVDDGSRPTPLRHIQNRIVEPVTPTTWVLDGYEEAASPAERWIAIRDTGATSGPRSFADIAKGPGERQFLRMPTRVLFGHELVIAC